MKKELKKVIVLSGPRISGKSYIFRIMVNVLIDKAVLPYYSPSINETTDFSNTEVIGLEEISNQEFMDELIEKIQQNPTYKQQPIFCMVQFRARISNDYEVVYLGKYSQ